MLSNNLLSNIATTLINALGTNPILRIFAGTPPNPINTPQDQPLVEIILPEPQYNETTKHVEFSSEISGTILADGTASFFQIYEETGTTPLLQGTVGTSNTDIILENTNLTTPGTLTLTNFYISIV